MQTGAGDGHMPVNQALAELSQDRAVARKKAEDHSPDRRGLRRLLGLPRITQTGPSAPTT